MEVQASYRYAKCPKDAKLVEGRIFPWFGGKQPVPDNVQVLVTFNDGGKHTIKAENVNWVDAYLRTYQLTGRIL